MDAHTPKSEIRYDFKESFNIKSNENKDIKLTISYNERIILFEVEELNIFPKKEYSLYQSLNELEKINRYFRQFDNLKEVYESLKIIILNKNITAIKEENCIKLKIINTSTNKEFFINLPLKQKDIKTQIESLIPYISSLDNKINNLENQIKDMKEDFDNKIKSIEKKHKEDIEKLEKKFEETIQTKILFSNSNIIHLDEENLIKSWFDKVPISAKLLLNANIDNNFWYSFFNNCGNKPNTMIFIKTTENLRFGGYTSQIWPTYGTVKDEKSFLFSLTNKEKYKIIKPEYAIGTSNANWISFGFCNDLYLYNNLNSEGGGTVKSYYDIPSNIDYYLNGGKNKFKLSNCEIYQIEF